MIYVINLITGMIRIFNFIRFYCRLVGDEGAVGTSRAKVKYDVWPRTSGHAFETDSLIDDGWAAGRTGSTTTPISPTSADSCVLNLFPPTFSMSASGRSSSFLLFDLAI